MQVPRYLQLQVRPRRVIFLPISTPGRYLASYKCVGRKLHAHVASSRAGEKKCMSKCAHTHKSLPLTTAVNRKVLCRALGFVLFQNMVTGSDDQTIYIGVKVFF